MSLSAWPTWVRCWPPTPACGPGWPPPSAGATTPWHRPPASTPRSSMPWWSSPPAPSPRPPADGFAKVQTLKADMDEGRRRRLSKLGFDQAAAGRAGRAPHPQLHVAGRRGARPGYPAARPLPLLPGTGDTDAAAVHRSEAGDAPAVDVSLDDGSIVEHRYPDPLNFRPCATAKTGSTCPSRRRSTASVRGGAGMQDVFYASSIDQGRTFGRNVRVTDRSIGVYARAIGTTQTRHRLLRHGRLLRLAGQSQKPPEHPVRGTSTARRSSSTGSPDAGEPASDKDGIAG